MKEDFLYGIGFYLWEEEGIIRVDEGKKRLLRGLRRGGMCGGGKVFNYLFSC